MEILEEERLEKFKGFRNRMEWFLKYRQDLASLITIDNKLGHNHRLLAVPTRERLCRILAYLLDENEFLSPFGIRSLSKIHAAKPYIFRADGREYRVDYVPGEGNTHLFGGNSNWRGPVWFPINYLIVEALERYYHFYGDDLKVECPTGSGNLHESAASGKRNCPPHGQSLSAGMIKAADHATVKIPGTPLIRTGRNWSCSMNIFTGKRARLRGLPPNRLDRNCLPHDANPPEERQMREWKRVGVRIQKRWGHGVAGVGWTEL